MNERLDSCLAHSTEENSEGPRPDKAGKWQICRSKTGNAKAYALACKQSRTKRRWVDVKTAHDGSSRSIACLIGRMASSGLIGSVF